MAEASHAPDTKVLPPSLHKDRLITSPVWPIKEVNCCPVSISQRQLKKWEKTQYNSEILKMKQLEKKCYPKWRKQSQHHKVMSYHVVSPELVKIWESSKKRQHER